MIEQNKYVEFNDRVFSLDHIKYVEFYYRDGIDNTYDNVIKVTYWDGDIIELVGMLERDKQKLKDLYQQIKEVLLADDYDEW